MSSASDVVPQRSSVIDQMLMDEIRSGRRLASSTLNSKVSDISSSNLDAFLCKRRNALVDGEAISVPIAESLEE
ncbi:hypothetical protein M9Y10_045565 [Tritrichomonas musculus]|uniref:Uncharacterized protein n=1 Tax=Tritrichomonas musculus TaxID=1915356 RepID=A0ABR2JVL1_9EUKA